VGPNDAELVRVFTTGDTIGDITFPVGADFKAVVEAEAGSAIFGSGAQFKTNIVVRDISANNDIAFTPAAGFPAAGTPTSLNSTSWPNQNQKFEYTVASGGLAGREGHVCQVIAFLTVGVTNPDSSFAVSSLFMLTP
jgi:hypothetical protein